MLHSRGRPVTGNRYKADEVIRLPAGIDITRRKIPPWRRGRRAHRAARPGPVAKHKVLAAFAKSMFRCIETTALELRRVSSGARFKQELLARGARDFFAEHGVLTGASTRVAVAYFRGIGS